jgi:hypothetical protein
MASQPWSDSGEEMGFFRFFGVVSVNSATGSRRPALKRDAIGLNRHRALTLCLSMISAQTRPAFVARENRFALCRIML